MTRRSASRTDAVLCLALLTWLGVSANLFADDDPKPIAAYIPLRTPLDAKTFGLVRNRTLEMQEQAQREDRPAVLFLEIPSGTSDFPEVLRLANVLVDPEIARVRTVAWIPEDVTGNHAILALACREIVMHPEAKLGDAGRGKPLEEFEIGFVEKLVENRHNPKVTPGLARGMCDPAVTLIRATVTEGDTTEVSVLTKDEIEEFRKGVTGAIKTRVLSEPGDPFAISGQDARDDDVLVVATAEDRSDVEKLYGTPLLLPEGDTEEEQVALVKIDDRVDTVMAQFIERQTARAVGRGVSTIVFEIESPGGVFNDCWELAEAIAAVDESVRTVAYVPKGENVEGALGGAAVIALGCDAIFMQEGATIGDIGAGLDGADADQIKQGMEDLARKKGRPPAIALAMVVPTKVVRVRHVDDGRVTYMTRDEMALAIGEWIEDGPNPVIPESVGEELLKVDAQRAAELQIAEPPVADFASLKARVGVPVGIEIEAAEKNWVDDVVFLLNTNWALFILLVAGFVLMFLEAHLMTGAFFFGSVMCFVLLFWSRALGGTAGWLEVILFVAGVTCIALEAFVFPGFGFFGITGGLLVFGSIVMATQTFGNIEPNEDVAKLSRTMTTMGASVLAVVCIGLVASRYLPHIPLFRHMILQPPGGGEDTAPQLKRELTDTFAGVSRGDAGVASTTLRPAGKATIKGTYLDVVSDGPFIQAGEPVEVVSVAGNRVVVKRV